MSAQTVFRSSDPSVLDVWARDQQAYDTFAEMCRQWIADYPDHKLYTIKNERGARISYLAGPKPGEAWRASKDRRGWVPTKANGKRDPELLERWAATTATFHPLPGMPQLVWPALDGTDDTDNRVYRPGARLIAGVLYVTWGCRADLVKHDETLWTPTKLSEYYAAVEAAEAAHA